MPGKQKKKPHTLVVDGKGHIEGLPESMAGRLDTSYHMIEELAVSAHALGIFKEFLSKLSNQKRDKLIRLCDTISELLPVEDPIGNFLATQMLYVNTYARIFDGGIVNMFNQMKMERETIASHIQHMSPTQKQTEPQEKNKKTPGAPEVQ